MSYLSIGGHDHPQRSLPLAPYSVWLDNFPLYRERKYISAYVDLTNSILAENTFTLHKRSYKMSNLTIAQVESLTQEFSLIGDAIDENGKVTLDIQERQGKALTTKPARVVFCQYMTDLFAEGKKAKVKRIMDCIDKVPTQQYIQKLKAETKLTKKVKFRTADKGLLDKGIATAEQVAAKGIYHEFHFPIAEVKQLTKEEAIQKKITDRKTTKEEFLDMNFTFYVEPTVAH